MNGTLRLYFLAVFCLPALHDLSSQTCSCSDNFKWLQSTFEKNDAGFNYVIETKGRQAYDDHTGAYAVKAQTITSQQDCEALLSGWLSFFRKGHLYIERLNENTTNKQGSPETNKAKIRDRFKDWERVNIDLKSFQADATSLKNPGFEGVWRTSSSYTIGVKKVKEEYLGFIIQADGFYWSPSQVKFRITGTPGNYKAVYYMQDHSPNEIKKVSMAGSNYLNMGFVMLERISPVLTRDSVMDLHYRSMEAKAPFYTRLHQNTSYLRIPSFSESFRSDIDSVIGVNMNAIRSAENLIIDLRYNGGGSDGSFQSLLPIIYTNPFRTIGVEYLSTPLNNERMSGFLKEPGISKEEKEWIEGALKKLNSHPNEFVSLEDEYVSITKFDSVFARPKQIAILINEGCGSTTEQFILAAKQSRKVKLFGTMTYGSLDMSNMHSAVSPCKEFELGYCLSRSKRIPDFMIDGMGLQPDFYIDKSIPDHEWIRFAEETLLGK